MLSGCASVRSFWDRSGDPESLLRFLVADVQSAFALIESDLDGTARLLERTGPSGGAARELLEGLSLRHLDVSSAFSARADGTVVASEPIPHRRAESEPDDLEAFVLWRPVPAFGEYEEARVGVVVSLAGAFDRVRFAPGVGVDVWMLDLDGAILADVDGLGVGGNVLTDSAYGDMSDIAKMILERSSGREQYTFFGPDFVIVTEVGWDTVRLGHREWRLVVSHVVEGKAELDDGVVQ